MVKPIKFRSRPLQNDDVPKKPMELPRVGTVVLVTVVRSRVGVVEEDTSERL